MKLRTRKFLAGLLSLGLLLQAASPLSALAAEDAPVATHTLTVTVGNTTYNLTANGGTVSSDETWPLGYPAVSYDDGFAFEGGFNGDVTLNGGENVTIKGESYAVNGSLNATVNDLTVTKSDSGTDAAIRGDATITSAGDVRISGNLDYNNISLVNQAVEGKLTVNSAQDVSIDGILNGGADINCQTLSLNCGNGSTVSGTLTVHNAQKIQATAFAIYGVIGDRGKAGKLVLDHCTGAVTLCNTYGGYEAVQAGTVEVRNLPTGYVARYYAGSSEAESTETEDPNDCARYSYFRIEYVNPSNKTLTLTNAKAYTDAAYTTELINATSANGTSTYHVDEGKTVYVKAVAPGEGQWKFGGWIDREETSEKITVTVTEDMTLTAKWVERTTHTLTLKYAEAYEGETKLVGTAGENGTTTYTVENGKELTIKAVAPDETQQWMFKGWTGSNKTDKEINVTVHENMALTANWVKEIPEPDEGEEVPYGITVTIGNNPPIEVTSENCGHILGVGNDKLTYDPDTHTLTGTGSFGKMKVEITDDLEDKVDVVLSNANGAVVNGSLTVTGAQDVEVTGTSSSALIDGKTTISCAGDILMENTGTGNVIGIHSETDLVVNKASSVTIKNVGTGGNDSYAIYGRADITCSSNVEIVSSNDMAIWDPIVVTGAKDVKIKAAGRAIWDERHDSTIMTKIECSGKVEITSDTAAALHAGNLIIKGATDVTISGKRDEGATIGGDAEITCSGDVVLENKGTGAVVESKLVYKQNPAKGYEVKTGENAESATVAYTDEEGTTSYTVPNTETNPETNPVPSYISITAVGTPPVVPGDDDFTGGDSGAGGAVAAVLVGGAAVWGGYEITTRVILHNILPEGAEIPANRGQLALLVWNTAGRPEPVNTPAFADVADADTAKAAQWCVEQGIMDAKSESSFKPEGWMPKFKTIEVWEKAFPKQ